MIPNSASSAATPLAAGLRLAPDRFRQGDAEAELRSFSSGAAPGLLRPSAAVSALPVAP